MFIERFFNYLQYEKRFSMHTLNGYKTDLLQFHQFLSSTDCNYDTATHQEIRSWIVSLMEADTDPKTISRKLSTLRTFYKFLQRENLISTNPTLHIKAPKVPKRLPSVVDGIKLGSLLDQSSSFEEGFAGLRDRLVIELLFGTGIRLSELLTIKDSDVDFYKQQIKIFGKRSKERIVPLNKSLAELTEFYLKEKKQQNFENLSALLVVTNEGKAAYAKLVYRIVRQHLARITTNQKRSPHVLRHSFATSLLNNGADLNAIKELLGHASLAATQVYTHNSVERLKSIYKQAHPKA
ncbi:tyrosine-type recombinase/integrase [Pedobacter sp. SYSU D00535]|uniref:tyrosine-type recombinase/integrase n=1 Tax=Pedobacter sp. SYSU D00535 TaxID=2810308 RepID=UPI001A957684|nr:tyrosine-type recombinase/integrase [Pedobacter sp. SYSU D00535]